MPLRKVSGIDWLGLQGCHYTVWMNAQSLIVVHMAEAAVDASGAVPQKPCSSYRLALAQLPTSDILGKAS